jgi:hypothetical protein
MSEGIRSAFVVANDEYRDPRLSQLRAPAADARELVRVLGDPEIGGFEVEVSLNEPEHVIRRRLSAFFDNRGVDDLLLLHLSCHGLKDDDGRLYFATPDTEVEHLDATSIPSEFVNRQMTRSRSRRIVLLLDCCYSGAFARGVLSRASDRVDIKERFDGRGRIVLTASSAMEYSFEGDELAGEGQPSVFTSALVRGLSTGEADRNRDGFISIDELYDFAFDQVRAVTPSQTPGKWVFDVQGDFYIARSGLEAKAPVGGLPPELLAATKSPFAYVRAGAVEELAGLVKGPDETLSEAARAALDELADDDSQRVAAAVARAFGRQAADVGEPVPDVVTVEVGEPAPVAAPVAGMPGPRRVPAVTEPPVPHRVSALLRVAAVALLAALPIPLIATGYESWNIFAVMSPFEVAGAAIAVSLVARAVARDRMGTSLASGILTVVGLLICVAALGSIKFSVQRINPVATLLACVVLLGSVAILASGVACMRASSSTAAVARVDAGAFLLALAGAGFTFAALFVKYDGYSSLWSEVGEGTSAEFFFGPAVAVALIICGMVVLGSWARFAAAVLIAAGVETALHFLGVIIAAWRAIGEVGEVRAAGFIGVLGGLLAAWAGAYALRSARWERDNIAPNPHLS